ncbi:MAG: hypothetical protein ABSA12_13790 [Verrucomicrobiia bacterium]
MKKNRRPQTGLTEAESLWLMNFFRALISRIGQVVFDGGWTVKRSGQILRHEYNLKTANAARRARARNIGRALSLPNMPDVWQDGARAGYAVALVPKAAEVWDSNTLAHLRELLIDRITRALSTSGETAAEFRQGMLYGLTFDPSKTRRKDSRKGRGDDLTAKIDRIVDEHFDEVLACRNSGEVFKLVKKHLSSAVVGRWTDAQIKAVVWRLRQLLRRELGLTLAKRGRPRKTRK